MIHMLCITQKPVFTNKERIVYFFAKLLLGKQSTIKNIDVLKYYIKNTLLKVFTHSKKHYVINFPKHPINEIQQIIFHKIFIKFFS